MCRRAVCPNDGKPTWWGCGNHIEQALAGVPEDERCQCPHEPVEGNPSMKEVRKRPEVSA
ncbi:hypothetical protein CC85DRAFT_330364 [Cutaneotrichosporon oleaginosum]|uniref:Uncharacterized protein n=1 Tax=Cutaneotrichosporon oleaginosum TaxID=879819 RepID=A0A0J0XFP8_9TREE|nr:uncharacterized protein CC85DRAFT_330364 [Cutaneotrichosporon oleaginosum]KLT39893.1 hypothetical protein CC85DRAFT_330364 [Cutaneotrichosporon oleaginosum]TXT14215.1 hypothetical protein COLE_00408 [Cutaneotrichosporon oleaginosum]